MLVMVVGLVVGPAFAQAQTANDGSGSRLTEAQVEAALTSQSSYTTDEIEAAIRTLRRPGKDDPTQAPIGSPVALVFIAAALLFMPGYLDLTPTAMAGAGSPDSPLEAPMSCPIFSGSTALITEDGCVWTKVSGQTVDFDGTRNTAQILSAGGQTFFAPGWIVGGAFQARTSDIEQEGGFGLQAYGQAYDASLALKHIDGPWLFAGSIAFATSNVSIDPSAWLGQTNLNSFGAGMRLRGAYTVDRGRWYLRPRIDVDGLYNSTPGFQITLGDRTLKVDGTSTVGVEVSPTIEIGGRVDLSKDTILRPYVSAGMTFPSNNTSTTTVSLVDADIETARFGVKADMPSLLAQMEAGFQLYQERGFEIETAYGLSAGDAYTAQSLSLRGAWHF